MEAFPTMKVHEALLSHYISKCVVRVVIVSFAKTMKMMYRKSSHYWLHFGKGSACEKGDKGVFKGV